MLSEPVLIDTGPLIALYNSRDPDHRACVALLETLPVGKVYTCWPVVVEASYLLRRYPQDRDRLLAAIMVEEFVVLPLKAGDLRDVRTILNSYRDQEIDFADASLVHLANHHSISAIFTLDRRHFNVFRSKSGQAFRLLPDSF